MSIRIRPLMYGYCRPHLLDPNKVGRVDAWFTAFAWGTGCDLGTVFREGAPDGPVPPVFADLIGELRRSQAGVLAVLPDHLRGMALPEMVLRDWLAEKTRARVWVLHPMDEAAGSIDTIFTAGVSG